MDGRPNRRNNAAFQIRVLSKKFNEQNNGSACTMYILVHFVSVENKIVKLQNSAGFSFSKNVNHGGELLVKCPFT